MPTFFWICAFQFFNHFKKSHSRDTMSDCKSVGSEWTFVRCYRSKSEVEEIHLLALRTHRARLLRLLRKTNRTAEEEREVLERTSTKDTIPRISRGAEIAASSRVMDVIITWKRQKGMWCPAEDRFPIGTWSPVSGEPFPIAIVEETAILDPTEEHGVPEPEGLVTATPATVVEVLQSETLPADAVEEAIYEEIDDIYGSFIQLFNIKYVIINFMFSARIANEDVKVLPPRARPQTLPVRPSYPPPPPPPTLGLRRNKGHFSLVRMMDAAPSPYVFFPEAEGQDGEDDDDDVDGVVTVPSNFLDHIYMEISPPDGEGDQGEEDDQGEEGAIKGKL